jgi:TRAP-type mannitol/chloroaromatic compound transport system permease small subunit
VAGARTRKPILKLVALIDAFTDRLGRVIAWLLPAMVAVTALIVLLRYALSQGAVVLQESVLYMHAVVFMLGIPYALKEDAHVRVDLIYARLGRRGRAIVDLLGHLLFLVPVAVALYLYSRSYVAGSWRILEGSSEVGGIPAVFLLKTLIPLTAVLLLLQGLAEIIRCLAVVMEPGRD